MKLLNLPNSITLSRIAIVPVILLLAAMETQWSCFFATLLFIVAALSDLVDGYLARKNNLITSLGKFLDPLADKVLVSSVLIMFVELAWVPAWIVIVIICRDLMVTGLRAVASDEGVVIAADKYGKWKTTLQMIALVPLLLHHDWFGLPLIFLGTLLLYVSLFLTVFSGVNYFLQFFRVLRGNRAQPSGPGPDALREP